MKIHLTFILIFTSLFWSCDSKSKPKIKNDSIPKSRIINPIPIDVRALSGLDLKPVTNQSDPDRRLFQKQLFRGLDLSVYVVSSETATAKHESYGIDEFLYVLNGRARLNPENGDEVFYNTGDFFIAPKGFNGEWETQGGDEFLIEVSVITTKRSEGEIDPSKTLPYLIDKAKLSGIGISAISESSVNSYKDELYRGAEIDVDLLAELPGTVLNFEKPDVEQFVYIISGSATIQAEGGDEFTFYQGDFYLLPNGFRGTIKTSGHGLFRYMKVVKSN